MADTINQRPLDTIRAVRAARLQVAFEGQPPALALAMLLATIALVVLWPSSEPARALAWYGTFVVITAGRISLYCRYRYLHFRTSATNGTSFFLALPLRLRDAPSDDAERTTVVLPVALS